MKIGVFGGTFDPPHLGHLILAAEAQFQLRLDQVWFVLTPTPPHKLGFQITPVDIRLNLLRAALKDSPGFSISRVEIDRPPPHFAADTVRLLKSQLPQDEIIYLLGGDSLHDLPTWYNPQEFVAHCDLLGVMRRPGDAVDLQRIEAQLPGITAKVRFIDAPLIEVSSSKIRARVAARRPYRYFLPPQVVELIEAQGLYRSPA